MRGFTAVRSSTPKRSFRICGDTLEPIQKTMISSLSEWSLIYQRLVGKKQKFHQSGRHHWLPWRSSYFLYTKASWPSRWPCLLVFRPFGAAQSHRQGRAKQRAVDRDSSSMSGDSLKECGVCGNFGHPRTPGELEREVNKTLDLYRTTSHLWEVSFSAMPRWRPATRGTLLVWPAGRTSGTCKNKMKWSHLGSPRRLRTLCTIPKQ